MKTNTNFEHLVRQHPCYNPLAHLTRGRVHLPVSPACNIQCNFCRREFNKTEVRPGVAGRLVSPQEAPDLVSRALELCPEISVAGIAGPGDTLATAHAVEAFRGIHQRHPQLTKCLSTNGLMLEQRLPDLLELGLGTLTVTVNGVDPAVVSKIVASILWDGRILRGDEGAKILIRQQLAGIRLASEAGLTIKVNMVLVPGVNSDHVEEVARVTAEAGASLINLIPLIPQQAFAHLPPPDCDLIDRARKDAEKHLPVFRHCQHCRADACGIPGKRDLSQELYGEGQAVETFSHG